MHRSIVGRRLGAAFALCATLLGTAPAVLGQTAPPPAWGHTKHFKYNIENVVVAKTASGSWNVRIIFSVSDPQRNGFFWNIKTDLPFTAGGSLTANFGWDPGTDHSNTGSDNALLTPLVSIALGAGAAMPVQARNLTSTGSSKCENSTQCPGIADLDNRFFVERAVRPLRFTQDVLNGRVALEGRPVCNGLPDCPAPVVGATGALVYANVPVRSETADFRFADSLSARIDNPRRKVVDFETKCASCHNGVRLSGNGTRIPRLSLHGGNRNENLDLCVMCHHPSQTDVPYRVISADARTSAPETSVDFKRMIHSIHAGEFRSTRYVVIGRNTSINDFGDVRFPARLRDCTSCHLDNGSKGTFELPLPSAVPGTTVVTGSVYAVPAGTARSVDVNPFNDLRITPTAATCSGCHDKPEVRSHMIRTGGASFGTLQQAIGVTVRERCVNCHGPGKDKSVRKAHEIRSGGRSHDD